MKNIFEKAVARIFIDSIFVYKLISCHRLSSRSLFLRGRQFHICARCTGLLIGLPLSLFLIPLSGYIGFLFPAFLIMLVLDGFTQRLNLRESNNKLRLITGITTGSTFVPCVVLLVIKLI